MTETAHELMDEIFISYKREDEARVARLDCTSAANGMTCSFEGEAICEVEERRVQESETCGN